MEMVKLESLRDYDTLPLTKWNIKQPNLSDQRENALETGTYDILLIITICVCSGYFPCNILYVQMYAMLHCTLNYIQ